MYPDCRHVLRHVVVAISLLASLPLAAQNLLQNPGFATALPPWQPFNGFGQTTVWSSFDAAGNPNSGSAFVTIPASSTFRQPPAAQQCVAIQPNTTYVYGGNAYLPTATAADGADAFASAQFFPTAGCAGGVDVFQFSPHVSTRDAWVGILDVITSGPSDLSVQIYPYVDAPTGTLLQLYFDDMFLLPDAIFRGGFE
jgi:hypothetical protein